MKNSIKTRLGKLVNYATCVVLLPFVIVAYQFSKNIQYLYVWHAVFFCCVVAIAFLVLFFIAKAIIKSEFGAFLFSCIMFFSFFLFEIFDFTLYIFPQATRIYRAVLYFGCAFILAGLLAFSCWKYKEKLKSKTITIAIFVMLCSILVQNIALIVIYSSQQQTNDQFYKEDFNITQGLEGQPNIYWIHCDGMLGFDSMSHFFGDEQEEFARELESRGFWINREAILVANHSTAWAVPALMSPFYYDRVLSWELDPEYAKAIPKNGDLLNNPSLKLSANATSNTIAREKNETVIAFDAAGFNTSTIYEISKYFYPTVNQFYTSEYLLTTTKSNSDLIQLLDGDKGEELRNLFAMLYTPEVLFALFDTNASLTEAIASNFTITDIENKVDLFSEWETDDSRRAHLGAYCTQANSLYDTFDLPEPRFTLYGFNMAHNPFNFDEFGNYNADDAQNPLRYPAHHTFSANTLLKYIDMILEHDPDAVIVLQADHGLHGLASPAYWGIKKTLQTFSITREQANGLWDQVMSAVRLPEEQMTPETEQILSDPRNISRYLINTYVGENYEYIPNEYWQTIERFGYSETQTESR